MDKRPFFIVLFFLFSFHSFSFAQAGAPTPTGEAVADQRSHWLITEQIGESIKLFNLAQKQLEEARTFTKNALDQVDNLKAIRGTLYHYYNNTFGVLGEAYRTYEKFKSVTDPDQYKQIMDEFENNLNCLKNDMDDMVKLKNIFKTRYQFDAEDDIKNQKEKIRKSFYAPGTNNNEFIAPYRNPSLQDQNLSDCGGMLSFAKVRERRLKQIQGLLQMLSPTYKKELAAAKGFSGMLPEEVLELRYQSIVAKANCPDQDVSQCDGAKLKEEIINAFDSVDVKNQKEERNKLIRSLNESKAKTPAAIAEDQLVVQMYILETLKSVDKKLHYGYERLLRNDAEQTRRMLEQDYRKNLHVYGNVDGIAAKEYSERDDRARDIGLKDLRSYNANLK